MLKRLKELRKKKAEEKAMRDKLMKPKDTWETDPDDSLERMLVAAINKAKEEADAKKAKG